MPRYSRPLLSLWALLLFLAGCDQAAPSPDYQGWETYHGDDGRSQYAALDQINRANVDQLTVAWTFRSGDATDRSQIQTNPIIIDTVLYAVSPSLHALALHAASGTLIWRYDPAEGMENPAQGVSRGVMFWDDGADGRILYTVGTSLIALNARTGRPIPHFGVDGRVDLRQGLNRDIGDLFVGASSPGAIFEDLLIMGSRVSEGPGLSVPGHIRAYDLQTGVQRWIFHTIPHPGEQGYETWPEDAWQRVGGANSWAGMSVDAARGLVFIPTGSPAFDFWGGDRPGENLFGNTLLALDARTGERVWHYQFVRHDIWDRDLPAPPNLMTLMRDGESVDAVAQITKSGHVFVFDRATGAPLFPMEERAYPPSDLRDEATWPTQVLPTAPPPFARQALTEENLSRRTPEVHAALRARLQAVRSGGQYVPPSTQGTIIFPGFDGGGEWGGAAHDPETGILYVNGNEMPWILEMVDLDTQRSEGGRAYATHCASCHGADRMGSPQYPSLVNLAERVDPSAFRQLLAEGRGFMPSFGYLSTGERQALRNYLYDAETTEAERAQRDPTTHPPYGHTGYNRFFDQDGYPAVSPPWGTLNAIDLNAGTIKWSVPLGAFEALTEAGLPPTGTENYGGPVLTAGGLLFIGASQDERFRAFDAETGEILWETRLPAGGYATPATYEVAGRQYVVIAAGGGKMGTPSGDAYVAFALPALDP